MNQTKILKCTWSIAYLLNYEQVLVFLISFSKTQKHLDGKGWGGGGGEGTERTRFLPVFSLPVFS